MSRIGQHGLVIVLASFIIVGVAGTGYSQSMLKGPYLIYPGSSSQMEVLWQLTGTVTYTLEWGLDTSYGTGSTETTEYGSDHQHRYTITGLSPGTKYFYRVTAISGIGVPDSTERTAHKQLTPPDWRKHFLVRVISSYLQGCESSFIFGAGSFLLTSSRHSM